MTAEEVPMTQDEIEAAYSPFLAALRAGGFEAPAEGWTAELVAAHVATNNDLIASIAEQIAAGERPSYTNTVVIDDATLAEFANDAKSLGGLATRVERSAHRLAVAWAALDEVTGVVEVPSQIFDAGFLVRDGAFPIRDFIEGNASFHLQIHFDQLMALHR
jgi:hypothetical protein